MQCRITPLDAPGQFLLSECTHINFLKQAPQGQMKWQNDPNYEITELLGCGVYGTVCKGRNRVTGQVVAIKRIYMAQVCSGSRGLACDCWLIPVVAGQHVLRTQRVPSITARNHHTAPA